MLVRIQITFVILFGLVTASIAVAANSDSIRTPLPTINIANPGKCIAETNEMRRNHMEKILHQRDLTMHDGIRTKKNSLSNCINCHADKTTNSVLGKDGFCESCHTYSAVSMDCFSCHNHKRESKTSVSNKGEVSK